MRPRFLTPIHRLLPALVLTAFALSSCDVRPEGKTEKFLTSVQKFNDGVQSRVFNSNKLSPEVPDSKLTPESGFRVNGNPTPKIDTARWRLSVSGMVKYPGDFTLDQIKALNKRVQNTKHVCVEGWSMNAKWGGTPIRDFLLWIGADTTAKYVYVECADGYYESYDMPSILHPQSLLCYEAYGKPLSADHGAPLRIVMPTKLGYKSSKWLTKLFVTNKKPSGYWEDQGYDWFAGI